MTRVAELTDDGLLRRMIAGDEEAFTLLYRRRQPSIYRFALHMSGNRAVAEDVTQEVFMTLIRHASRFDPARGTLGAFLYGVARNHLRKRAEQERRLVPLVEDADLLGPLALVRRAPRAPGNSTNGNGVSSSGNGHRTGHAAIPTILDEFVSFETVGRVRQAIATLPENYREVVIFCELEEMSYEEVAAVLECPVGTVRSRLHRARAMLLDKLRHAYPERRASAEEA